MVFVVDDVAVAAGILRGIIGAISLCLAKHKEARRGAKEMRELVKDLQRTAALFATNKDVFDKALTRAVHRAARAAAARAGIMILDVVADEMADGDGDDGSDDEDDEDGCAASGEWAEVTSIALFANGDHKAKLKECCEAEFLRDLAALFVEIVHEAEKVFVKRHWTQAVYNADKYDTPFSR